MGIPLYFKTIISSYPEIKFDYTGTEEKCERLFLDFNGIIHTCVHNVDSLLSKEKFEEKLCENIVDELKNIIKFVNPSSLVYIGIDGIAPMAKIIQQRERRYKSSYLKQETNNIKQKYNHNICQWDTNAISPGTDFMNLMEEYIQVKINQGFFGVDIILSGSHEVGEGEHKIMKYINENSNEGNNFIYGLDADLIMLSLINKYNIYLLRETQNNIKNEYFLLNIQMLKKYLISELKSEITSTSLSNNEILHGYIFICFFLGNDFLPTFPSLSIDENGIDEIIYAYKKEIISKNRTFFDDNLKINNVTLSKFLLNLMNTEERKIFQIHQKYKSKEPFYKHNMSDYEKDIVKVEQRPLINKQYIQFKKDTCWKKKFYMYYNNVTQKEDIDDICNYYIKTLYWLINYYFKGCINYEWYYPYKSSPTINDLYDYIDKKQDIMFTVDENLVAVDYKLQLMLIMPYTSIHLLPEYIRDKILNNQKYRQLYPNKFKFLTYKKRFLHEAILLLPRFNIDEIKTEIQF